MSRGSFERFMNTAIQDKTLMSKINEATSDADIATLAKAHGVEFTLADVREVGKAEIEKYRTTALSDVQLDQVAGGGDDKKSAADVMVDNMDNEDLTLKQAVAIVVQVIKEAVSGEGFMAGPDGQGDYRTGPQPGGLPNPF